MQTLILLAIVFSLGCAGLPEKPNGELCTHYLEAKVAICNDIKSGHAANDVPIARTDKWVMFSPQTWKNIMDYIDALKRQAENKKPASMSATSKEISAFKKSAIKLKNETLNRR